MNIISLSTICEIGLWWEPQNPIDEKSTLAQVKAWYRHWGNKPLARANVDTILGPI